MVNKVDTAAALIQLGYDPAQGSNIMGVGPLQGFTLCACLPCFVYAYVTFPCTFIQGWTLRLKMISSHVSPVLSPSLSVYMQDSK